jgi:putative membrane protein insertion efficiency factor
MNFVKILKIVLKGLQDALVNVLVLLVKAYQIAFAGVPSSCRFEPTCSTYAIDAICKYGPFKGVAMAVWRVLRCNPWNPGGYDPVR